MSPLTKNLLTVLGLLTIGYGAYYLYTQQAVTALDSGIEDEAVYTNMLANTEVFILRSQELDTMIFDISVLDDARLRALRGFTKPVEDQPTGRTNPFDAAETASVISASEE